MATGESSDALSKPFVIGSIATWLGKKAEESRSHEWTIYLRAANPEEDLSLIVRKVVFVLHPTLQPPTRSERSPSRAFFFQCPNAQRPRHAYRARALDLLLAFSQRSRQRHLR